jgi:ABC-type glycerol-3-phosphate transport system substrate-binding protein
MMASGEYYDMVFTSSWVNNFDKNAISGAYADITDVVQKETPALYDSIGPYWDCVTVDGRILGVPVLKDMGAEEMYRLNADYFEGEKGMEIPERMTFADIEPFLKAYKEDHPDKYPLAMDKAGIPGFLNFLERFAGNTIVIPYDQDTPVPEAIPFWECEELMDRYRLLHKWYQAGYIHPDAAAIDSTTSDKSIPVRCGVAWKGYSGYSNPADWGFHVKTSIFAGPHISRTSEQGAIFGICAACDEEHVKACLKYIELLGTDRKFRDILAYGIEGKHFEYLENGTVLCTQTGRDRYPPRLYQTGSVVNASVESVSRDFLSDPDQWKKVYEGYETDGIFSRTKGFTYDITEKQDIITALTAIYSDYAAELRTGTSDPDVVIPQMKKRMEDAGIYEVVDDIQQQLNAWLEKYE